MEGFKIEQPKPITPEVTKEVKPDFFQKIKDGFNVIEFSDKELVELFDKKYENSDRAMIIYNSGLEIPIRDSDEKLVLQEPKDFSEKEKISNMRVLVNQFRSNMNDYVKKLSSEEELLKMASQKFSYYKQIKDIPEKPEETLKAMVEREIKG
jgi:hypothetical protein